MDHFDWHKSVIFSRKSQVNVWLRLEMSDFISKVKEIYAQRVNNSILIKNVFHIAINEFSMVI
jgi:hypothetical protein